MAHRSMPSIDHLCFIVAMCVALVVFPPVGGRAGSVVQQIDRVPLLLEVALDKAADLEVVFHHQDPHVTGRFYGGSHHHVSRRRSHRLLR